MFLICGVVFTTSVYGQTDTVFWFVAPEITRYTNNLDRPIAFHIATSVQPATVTITQPAGGGMPPQVVTIPAHTATTVDLTNWIDNIENKPPNMVLNYGLKLTSTAPVTIYYEVISGGGNPTGKANPEAFILKGRNALGRDFYIPSQNLLDNFPNVYTPTPYSAFEIVATENNTTVTITPSNPIVGHAAGVPFSILLNEGQTWSGTAASQLAAQHLQGSRVVSDKPIAITVKDDLLRSAPVYGSLGWADLGGDQIVPSGLLGTEYVAINGYLNAPGDQLFITAIQNGTTISKDGTLIATINAGDTYRIAVGGPSTYIETSQPAYVLQLSGALSGEVGLALLPSVRCTGNSSVSFVRSGPDILYMNILVESGGQGNFTLNGGAGVVTAGQFSPVPGTGGQYHTAQVSLPAAQYPQGSVITLTNTSSLFHLGVLDGTTAAGGMSYGYFSNFNTITAQARAQADTVCMGSAIALFADTISGASYTWTGPGFSSNQQNPVISNVSSANAGDYILTVDVNGCVSSDTIRLSVKDLPVVNLGNDTAVCGDTLLLQSSVTYTNPAYLWSTGAVTPSISTGLAGSYWLQVTQNGCAGSDTINVALIATLHADLGNDTGICDRDIPLILSAAQPPGTHYLWSNGLSDTQLLVTRTGVYWLEVSRGTCTGSDTIHVEVVPTPSVYIGADSIICEQFPARIGTEIIGASYLWSTGETTPYINVAQTDVYMREVNLRGCRVRDTINITAMPVPDIDLGGDRDICPEQTIILDGVYGTNSSYAWNTGETTPAISVSSAGVYWVQVRTEHDCLGGDTVVLTHYPKPVVSLGPDTVVCEETPLLLLPGRINTDSLIWSDGSVGNMLSVAYGGQYIVTGINKCGTGTDTIEVKQIFCDIWLPNAFTPNNDGRNDIFRVLGNTGRLEGFALSIFNRWGERLFYTSDKYQGWDGTQNGKEVLMGTYVYLLEYKLENRPYVQKGNFHLIR